MTNFEKWRFAHSHVTSPDSWVDAAWLFAVGAALQRRVWFRNFAADALFPNLYYVLIGPPACGKGLAMSQLKRVLFSHPKERADADKLDKPGVKVPMLINSGPDDGSYQGLMDCMTKATSMSHVVIDGKKKLYPHASIAMVLAEMNSIFKRNQDNVSKFLLQTYDCVDYNYTIVSRCTEQLIKNTCLSFIAGCTSSMLEEAARYGIFDSGFTSRCIFLFEAGPRYYTLDLPEMTAEQRGYVNELAEWVRRIAGVCGQLTSGPGVAEYLASKNTDYEAKMRHSSEKMQSYYGRQGQRIRKLAAAFHFSDSLELTVPVECFEKAYDWLSKVESKMVTGFAITGKNEMNHVAQKLLSVLRVAAAPMAEGAMFAMVMNDCGYDDYKSIKDGLEVAGLIQNVDGKYRLKP